MKLYSRFSWVIEKNKEFQEKSGHIIESGSESDVVS
jgi:hypothetical protein